jgi:tetratricopeptide (TPR) repeat protein
MPDAPAFPERHHDVVEAVDDLLHSVITTHGWPVDPERVQAIWHDFAAQRDVSRTQKPATWAAAVAYAYALMVQDAFSQTDAAGVFDVSTLTVSTKYREMTDVLDLTVADARYVPEARRQAMRRTYGAARTFEDVPLTDATDSLWHVPFGLMTDDPLFEAQQWTYEGWEALDADALDDAQTCFEAALDVDPWLADAHNGLGCVAMEADPPDLEAAAEHFQKAYTIARDTLGTEAPEAYHWWGQIETRPYMRARAGRADVWVRQGAHRKAAREYEALLRRNPNDNQGARYLVGPLYQQAGDLDAALAAYDAYQARYPDDIGYPHFTYCHGLARYRAGAHEAALRIWYDAFFQNPYVVPAGTDAPMPPDDIWHVRDVELPSFAVAYWARYGALWADAPDAQAALQALWADPEVAARREAWRAKGRALRQLAPAVRAGDEEALTRWPTLVTEQYAIEEDTLPDAVIDRVLA